MIFGKGRTLTSLKKYLEMEESPLPAEVSKPAPSDLTALIVDCCRTALIAMGDCAAQACPGLSSDLQQNLSCIERRLAENPTPPSVRQAEAELGKHLQEWGENAAAYFREKTNEVKDLLLEVARSAGSLGERDQRYVRQFADFAAHLQSIADLEDFTQMRASLVQSATEMRSCVDNMSQESIKSVAQLQAQVESYQAKLEVAEHYATRDVLTGLANRRCVEERIKQYIAEKRGFCILVIDLNGFKHVNDTFGHLAGDDLLKQFAAELRSNLRALDLVGRWGGDEFIAVVDGEFADAQAQLERVRQWVIGDYTLHCGAGTTKLRVDAAIGVAKWQLGESMHQVLHRADEDMYKLKPAPGSRRSRL